MLARKPREKHLPYYALRDALRESGSRAECALCSMERDRVRRYLLSILEEQVNDPRVRTDLARSHGYCVRHAHQLLSFQDALGTTILYLDQVTAFRKDLEALSTRVPLREATIRRKGARWTEHGKCPACRYMWEHRRRLLEVLSEGLKESEMQQALETAAPLCIPHFFSLLEIVSDSDLCRFLVRMQDAKLAELEKDLAEFYRKQDYRFRHESVEKERDAWSRAVAVMTGDPELFE